MSRCLAMAERQVAERDRAGYLHALAARREGAAAASAHFWVFEDAATAGRFLEFVEAGSEDALARAIEAVQSAAARTATDLSQQSRGMQVVWREVESNT